MEIMNIEAFVLSVLERDSDAGLIGLFGYRSGNEDRNIML